MTPPVRLRPAAESDVTELARVFRLAVETVGPDAYTEAQVAAWAAAAADPAFRDFVLGPHTVLAEDESGILGFGGLDDDGYLASLFVRPDVGRRGIGSRIVEALLVRARDRGIPRVHTAASAFSRGLFARHGFFLDRVEEVERRGVRFRRYRMVWHADGSGTDPTAPGPA